MGNIMSSECDNYKKCLTSIAKILDNVKYELTAREYTLNEDEMASIFYCRDVAQIALMNWENR